MQRPQGKPTICFRSVLSLAALLWVVPTALQASILLPRELSINLEHLLLLGSSGCNSTAPSSNGTSTISKPCSSKPGRQDSLPNSNRHNSDSDEPSPFGLLQSHESHASHGVTPSGTSTSSSSSTGGTSVYPLASSAAANLFDAQFVTWIGGEQCYSLPKPPGNKILRPPQYACSHISSFKLVTVE